MTLIATKPQRWNVREYVNHGTDTPATTINQPHQILRPAIAIPMSPIPSQANRTQPHSCSVTRYLGRLLGERLALGIRNRHRILQLQTQDRLDPSSVVSGLQRPLCTSSWQLTPV
jgi:hypothetical protein